MTEYDMLWFKKYYNSTSKMAVDDKEFLKLTNILKNQNDQNLVQVKITQIETDYLEKLKEIEILCSNEKEIDNLKSINSLNILQKELEIIKLLTKYSLQNNKLDYVFFTNTLKLLLTLSETLRTRIGQVDINIEKKTYSDDNISRCSYKFCSYKDSCNYNYNKSKNLCYQDHYVHNMVSGDLRILIDYIEQKYGEIKVVSHNKEILKTINTLSFVINHMENELKAKCMYLPESEIENYHFIKIK